MITLKRVKSTYARGAELLGFEKITIVNIFTNYAAGLNNIPFASVLCIIDKELTSIAWEDIEMDCANGYLIVNEM